MRPICSAARERVQRFVVNSRNLMVQASFDDLGSSSSAFELNFS